MTPEETLAMILELRARKKKAEIENTRLEKEMKDILVECYANQIKEVLVYCDDETFEILKDKLINS